MFYLYRAWNTERVPRKKFVEDTSRVIGRFETIRFTRNGVRLTLTHPWWYFWTYIPGMRKQRQTHDGKSIVLPNQYVLDWIMEMFISLPLSNPDVYVMDFDLSFTFISATAQFKRRGCVRNEYNRPVRLYKRYPTYGDYKTTVDVKTIRPLM
jgi:hypothetical protein